MIELILTVFVCVLIGAAIGAIAGLVNNFFEFIGSSAMKIADKIDKK